MPNTQIFSNQEALQTGNNRAAWKLQTTLDYFAETKYSKDNSRGFDFRDMYTLIPLIIDISEVDNAPEETKKEYYINRLKEIEDAFVFSEGAGGVKPDPERIKPYIRRLYESIATNYDIDWDNEMSIDNLFCSILAMQAIGTMLEKFPREIIELYPTQDTAKRLDLISVNNYINLSRFKDLVAEFNPELLSNLNLSTQSTRSHATVLTAELNLAFANATASESNVALLDPESSQITKMLFLEDSFSIRSILPLEPDEPNSFGEYTSDEAASNLFNDVTTTYAKTINEYGVTNAAKDLDPDMPMNLLLINGKPAREIFDEAMRNANDDRQAAMISAGKTLRTALLDGKSVVSLMRPTLTEDGRVSFKHQELKVDLNKLNRIERNEKHNIFRRALDYIGIWKIPPKFASNEQRDAMQTAEKNTTKYQNAIKAAERGFINTYNENASKPEANSKFFKAFPSINAMENENPIMQEDYRQSVIIEDEIENNANVPTSEINEEQERTLHHNNITK